MTEKTVDLKQLLLLIFDGKDVKANLNLDSGCTFETEDPKPLVKVLNYFINYLNQLTEMALDISLDLRQDTHVMSMMSYTDREELPALSGKIKDTLDLYGAEYNLNHKSGKYVQMKITFKRP